jgi:uncharacterized repeat protein (TIGR03803 family)
MVATVTITAQPLLSKSSVSRWLRAAAFALASALVFGLLLPQPAQSQTATVIHSFKGPPNDGVFPYAGVILDAAGNIYGTTWLGGTADLGTVFEISKHGETLLHSFGVAADGQMPQAGLVRDAAGNLYGTTTIGGGPSCVGTVFKINATGKETVLHCFAGQPTDGGYPLASVVLDAKGNLYGTTADGGTNNVGTVFELDTTGKETVLYSFTGGNVGETDGASPVAGVIRDTSGNLYGTTIAGGPGNWGTVFKLDAAGKETILFTFTGGGGTTDGNNPLAGLVRDAAGNLYGTTENGGGMHDAGTIFKVDQTGNETVLHTFYTTPGDGSIPEATLIRDAAGNLYGSTAFGGTYGFGTVFKYDTAGNETVLHSFNGTDGKYPQGGLAMDAAGNIYGTCQQGGTFRLGTVFKITP